MEGFAGLPATLRPSVMSWDPFPARMRIPFPSDALSGMGRTARIFRWLRFRARIYGASAMPGLRPVTPKVVPKPVPQAHAHPAGPPSPNSPDTPGSRMVEKIGIDPEVPETILMSPKSKFIRGRGCCRRPTARRRVEADRSPRIGQITLIRQLAEGGSGTVPHPTIRNHWNAGSGRKRPSPVRLGGKARTPDGSFRKFSDSEPVRRVRRQS